MECLSKAIDANSYQNHPEKSPTLAQLKKLSKKMQLLCLLKILQTQCRWVWGTLNQPC